MNQEQPIGSDQQGLVSARRRSAARWELKSRVALTMWTMLEEEKTKVGGSCPLDVVVKANDLSF